MTFTISRIIFQFVYYRSHCSRCSEKMAWQYLRRYFPFETNRNYRWFTNLFYQAIKNLQQCKKKGRNFEISRLIILNRNNISWRFYNHHNWIIHMRSLTHTRSPYYRDFLYNFHSTHFPFNNYTNFKSGKASLLKTKTVFAQTALIYWNHEATVLLSSDTNHFFFSF